MRSSRLTFALESAALSLPETGKIAVLRPHSDDDLDALPKDRLVIMQGFRPDHDAFKARGYAVQPGAPDGPFAAAMVCLTRARPEARALVALAARQVGPEGLVIVDGQKTDGVESMLRDLRGMVAASTPVSKAHGKLFTFRPGTTDFSDWQAQPTQIEGDFQTVAGVFSADGIDRGSALLAAALPEKLPSRIIDLGAGWGYLAREILSRPSVKELHLVEAEAAALDCARHNIQDPRAQFHWADARGFKLERGVDAVICNPPFHTTRDADPGLGIAFLTAAARLLSGHGTLWLVANRHLPYDRTLTALFRDVEEIGGDAAFRLIRAARPTRPIR
ncbi:MAG: 16S rRNA (guanine1207-N2)-methyltransferase [Pseudorhodobacter sp.]|jgi:16S rRNA (guanine1207-N2)-methyltransferase